MLKKLLNIIVIISLFGEFFNSASAQNAPVTTASTITNAIAGQQVTVQVTVTGFNNIGSVSLSMNYDFTKLQYVSHTLNSTLLSSGNFAFGDNDLGNGMHRIIAGWYNVNGVSLPDGTVLLTLVFTYISGSAVLEWYNDSPLGNACDYTDPTGLIKLNDAPFSTYYINGSVTGLTTGISSIIAEDNLPGVELNLYPNPTSHFINIMLPENKKGKWQFSVSSLRGIELKKFKMNLSSTGEVIQIDVRDLKPGSYYMTVIHDLIRVTRKFIVIRE